MASEHLLESVIEAVDGELLADTGGPYARVRLDRWMVDLIAQCVPSPRPSEIRAFVREAVIVHLGLRCRAESAHE